jgi:hypothetical protein
VEWSDNLGHTHTEPFAEAGVDPVIRDHLVKHVRMSTQSQAAAVGGGTTPTAAAITERATGWVSVAIWPGYSRFDGWATEESDRACALWVDRVPRRERLPGRWMGYVKMRTVLAVSTSFVSLRI